MATRVGMEVSIAIGEVVKLLQGSIPSTIQIIDQVDKNCGSVRADPSQMVADAGIQKFIMKPVTVEVLSGEIQKLLAQT